MPFVSSQRFVKSLSKQAFLCISLVSDLHGQRNGSAILRLLVSLDDSLGAKASEVELAAEEAKALLRVCLLTEPGMGSCKGQNLDTQALKLLK